MNNGDRTFILLALTLTMWAGAETMRQSGWHTMIIVAACLGSIRVLIAIYEWIQAEAS